MAGTISIITALKVNTVYVLGRDEGYTVKYTPLTEGKRVYLTVYPKSSPNMDSI